MSRSPAADLLRSVGLDPEGPVPWGTAPRSRSPGVYIVETREALAEAPLDMDLVQRWLARVPTLRVDGTRPTSEQLATRLGLFWIPNQRIVYIGLTTDRLSGRLSDYYRTPLGNRRPHAGGHWIRTLAGLENFQVWWSETSDPAGHEDGLLAAFARQVPAKVRSLIRGSDLVLLPFANKENAAKLRKPHAITKSTLRAPSIDSQVTPSVPAQNSTDARPERRRRGTLAEINAALQGMACADPDGRVAAVPAAAELDRRGLLPDSRQRPGKPLRDLVRAGVVERAHQEPNSRWWISCAKSAGAAGPEC